MYGRLIWVARNEIPKMGKMRRVARSVSTPRSDGEGEVDDPAGRHDLGPDLARAERDEQRRPDREQRRQPEDRRQRPTEAVDEDARERRSDREADRPRRPEDGDRRPEPARAA